MAETQGSKITGKFILMVILVAIVIGVVSAVLQNLILGHSNAAVTGGVVGATVAVIATRVLQKKST